MTGKWIVLLVLAGSFLIDGRAAAESVEYVFESPGIENGETARKAKSAVEALTGVTSVSPDTFKGLVTVRFDDDRLSVSDIVSALSSTGCVVSTFKKK